jgi:hypothetical protein
MLALAPSPLTPHLPPGISGAVPARKRGSCPERKRGGQPGNTNALKHGMRSARSLPLESSSLLGDICPSGEPLGGLLIDPVSLLPVFRRLLDENSKLLLFFLVMSKRSSSFEDASSCLRATVALVRMRCRLYRAVTRLQFPDCDLHTLARKAFPLVLAEFADRGLSERKVSSQPSPLDPASSANPILTDQQWQLIEPVLNSFQGKLDEDRKYKRRQPAFPSRLLFEAILLKLTFALPWEKLPGLVRTIHPHLVSFPLRRCQLLYRTLYSSGYLQTIYRRLYRHFLEYGGSTIKGLVDQGFFQLDAHSVYRTPGRPLTWQVFTALLFLQRARHNLLMHLRENRALRSRLGYLPARYQHTRRRSCSPAGRSFPSPASGVEQDSPPIPVQALPAIVRCSPGHSFVIKLINRHEFVVLAPVLTVYGPRSCHFYDLSPPKP